MTEENNIIYHDFTPKKTEEKIIEPNQTGDQAVHVGNQDIVDRLIGMLGAEASLTKLSFLFLQ